VTDERDALRDAVRGLLSRRSDNAAVRAAMTSPNGHDAALWATLGEIGVAGLGLPERYGGADAGLAETCVVAEELGRTLTPAPLLGSAVYAAQALLATADEGACAELLPGIADGRTLAALAIAGPAGDWTVPACTAAGPIVSGEAHYVLDGDLADVLLVAARTEDGVGLFVVETGQPEVRREARVGMDLTRRFATVRLAGARGRRVGGDAGAALRTARELACVVLAAEQVGAAARCLELTVEYTKTRVQFGRAIGSFQAVKHRLADLYVQVETARSIALSAATAAELTVPAAVAKVHCSEVFCQVAAEMIQLHGGIAITWEHDAQLYFKRAYGSAQLFGQPAEFVRSLSSVALAG
jgi:alkylation response protein AidB-like acyl-CoA dehydrogenase